MALFRPRDAPLLGLFLLVRLAALPPTPALKRALVRLRAEASGRLHGDSWLRRDPRFAAAMLAHCTPRQLRWTASMIVQLFWQDTFDLQLTRAERAALADADVSGLEHVRAALDAGHGAILWENLLFGRRHLAKHLLHARGVALHQVHSVTHLGHFSTVGQNRSSFQRRVITPLVRHMQRGPLEEILELSSSGSMMEVKLLADRLKANAVLCITADGGYGQRFVEVELLGRTRRLAVGMISLARSSGAPLLPLFCWEDRHGLHLAIEPPLLPTPGAGREEGALQMAEAYAQRLEQYVRAFPWEYHPGLNP